MTELSTRHIFRRVYQTATGRRDDDVWNEAWEHIREHLSESAGKEKARHSVFLKRYRSRDRVAELIAQAANAPSGSEASYLTVGGQPTGAPCLNFWRWFNEPIGEDGEETLWVVAGQDGKLVTAYPKDRHGDNRN